MLDIQQIESAIKPATKLITPTFIKVQNYLMERGVTVPMIEQAGIRIYPAAELFKRIYSSDSYDDRLAIVFKHYDIHGTPLRWWSARLVDTNPPRYHTTRGKMLCPPTEYPRGYLSPLNEWSKLKLGDTVYIHESCIKALNGSRLGYYSVGLNGVFGFSSRKHAIELIEEIRDIPWKPLQLKCKIVYDSNAVDNPNVQFAISELSARLYKFCGVRATHILLPKAEDDSHWGFDDFCVAAGDERAREYLESDGEEISIGEVELLKAQLNSEVTVVKSLGRVADQESGYLMSRQVFTDVNYAHLVAKQEIGEEVKFVNVPRLWLADPKRTAVERIDYMPGQPKIHANALNLWRGMGCSPSSGDIQPFFELLVNNIEDQAIVRWIFQWMAYPLQNIGAKSTCYLHAFGPSGVGKNMLVRPLAIIYGRNFVTMTKENLSSNFNSIYAGKQLIHIDELHSSSSIEDKLIAQKLKYLTTSPKIIVNQKGQPEYEINNYANLITTSNYYNSIKLDEDDRRACVVKFENIDDHRGDEQYWNEFVHWCDNGGAEALYAYLLDYDMDGFDPNSRAPRTKWKAEVTDAGRSPMERWVQDLASDPDCVIPMNNMSKHIFTSKELAVMYYAMPADDIRKGQVDALASTLRNAGFQMANDGKLVKVAGQPARYWVVKQREIEWTHTMCVNHLQSK